MKATAAQPWMKYYEGMENKFPKFDSAYLAIEHCSKPYLTYPAMTYYGKDSTYQQFLDRIDQIASALKNFGIHKGEIVTVMMLNSPDAIATFYALNKLGATANLISGLKPEADLIHAIGLTDTRLVITLDVFLDKLQQIRDSIPSVKKIVVTNVTAEMSPIMKWAARITKKLMPKKLPEHDIYESWEHFLDVERQTVEAVADETLTAALIYTSGTTGGSKGVELTNHNLLSIATSGITSDLGYEPAGLFLNHLPLFVVSGLVVPMQCALMVGSHLLIRIPGQETLQQLLKLKPNYVVSYPEDFYEFDMTKKMDLSDLKVVLCGSDFLAPEQEMRVSEYFKACGSSARLNNCYGLTEGCSGVVCGMNRAFKVGSVGIPLIGNVISAFDAESNEEKEIGETGEICVLSDSVMKGYFGHKAESDRVLRRHADGKIWLHTGDLGYVDEDGFVFINGRMKRNMAVKIGNTYERIFSADVESVLRRHPAVFECFVVPKEDNEKVQLPVAYIRLKEGFDKEAAYKSLKNYADDFLNEFHRPDLYAFVESFPLTPVQKIDLKELEKRANRIPLRYGMV